MSTDAFRSLLAAYAAGTLDDGAREEVAAHVSTCGSCRADLAAWRAVRSAVRAAPVPVPPTATIVAAALAGRASTVLTPVPVVRRPGPRSVWTLVSRQGRLVRRSLWTVSLLMMTLGVTLSWLGPGSAGHTALGLLAPMVAAAGIAGMSGPENDPGIEITLATPTSPRLVLLARLTLVLSYDLVLAGLASLVLAWTGAGAGFGHIVAGWFGPMALLSAISLALSVWVGPGVSIGGALAVWSLRALASRPATAVLPEGAREAVLAAWSTNLVTCAAAVVLLAAALAWAPRPRQVVAW